MSVPPEPPDDFLPDWETFEADYVVPGLPTFIAIRQAPILRVFVDQGAARIGGVLALADSAPVPPSPLDEVDLREIREGGVRILEVSTRSRALYRSFFRLLSDIIAAVAAGAHPLSALDASVAEWRALLQSPTLLNEQRQAGLFGELLVLRRLIGVMGDRALDSWTGPAGQAHDFRIGDREFEVKTTAGTRRIHMINGVTQLAPSPDCSLHIVSMMLAHGGTGGVSLSELTDDIGRRLDPFPGASARFIDLLRGLGYRPEDAVRYLQHRRLRAPIALIAVADGCPRLVAEALAHLPPGYAAARLGRLTYEVDLHAMGVTEGDPEFDLVLPIAAVPAGNFL